MQILKKELKLKGWNVKRLNKELGYGSTESAINAWLAGRANPRAEMVKKLKDLGFSETACLNPSKDIEV